MIDTISNINRLIDTERALIKARRRLAGSSQRQFTASCNTAATKNDPLTASCKTAGENVHSL
ncbi:MAG: hypothetical protein LUE98_21340 [Tannerellaceae bacterium]|nr:hypothetical protein [Tannerellaceae bacterium]